MEDNTVALAAIALLATVFPLVVKLLNDNTRATREQTKAQFQVADSVQALVAETKKGNNESKKRNGHLGELIVQQGEQTKALADNATKNIINVIKGNEV